VFSSAAIVGNLAYVGASAGGVLVLDLATKEPEWPFPVDNGSVHGCPLVLEEGGRVIFGTTTGDVYWFTRQDSTARRLAKFETLGQIFHPGLLAQERAIFAAGDALWAFSVTSATPAWKRPVKVGVAFAPPARAGEWVLVANAAGELVAVSHASGELAAWRWKDAAGKPLRFAVDPSGRRAFVATASGHVRALSVPELRPIWERDAWRSAKGPGQIAWAPPAAGLPSQVLVAFESQVDGLDPETGEIVWRARAEDGVPAGPLTVKNDVVVVATTPVFVNLFRRR
jgi:outer membrane protein assembly factor BamB